MPTTPGPGQLSPADLSELLRAFNDTTERLRASHEQLRAEVARLSLELTQANEQLERARRLAALGEMAAGIAHEVRNPLGSIRLFARMLEQDLAEFPPQAGIAAKISLSVRQAEAIVSDVLTFSREFKLRYEDVDPDAALERALDSSLHAGHSSWQAVEVSHPATAKSLSLRADGALVQQTLVNVIRNAFEAMEQTPRSHHRLEVSCVPSRLSAGDGTRVEAVAFRVRDTGPGVSPDVVARMFNPFFTTRAAGTGLGLAIVHRIVDAHAGRIIVTNNASAPAPDGWSEGACVEIVLPAGEPALQLSQEQPGTPEGEQPLVVVRRDASVVLGRSA